jgi:hypothetical protein
MVLLKAIGRMQISRPYCLAVIRSAGKNVVLRKINGNTEFVIIAASWCVPARSITNFYRQVEIEI